MSILGVAAGILSALAVNEACDVSPWAARKIVGWSARLRYADTQRAASRDEELAALIDARPGKLFKLITALAFAAAAIRVRTGQIAAGITVRNLRIVGGRSSAAAVAAIVSVVLAAGLILISVPIPEANMGVSGSVAHVMDGRDPMVRDCTADAMTTESSPVFEPPGHLAGMLQLRTSSHCGASWGRFVPAAKMHANRPLLLNIDVYRPSDHAAARFRIFDDGLSAYGNMLADGSGCVYAAITIATGKAKPESVRTHCATASSASY